MLDLRGKLKKEEFTIYIDPTSSDMEEITFYNETNYQEFNMVVGICVANKEEYIAEVKRLFEEHYPELEGIEIYENV